MTLSYSTKWPERMGDLAGQPNFFPFYIWMGLPEFPYDHIKPIPEILNGLQGINKPIEYYYQELYSIMFKSYWDSPEHYNLTWTTMPDGTKESSSWRSMPKLHTIREDSSNRWRAGMDIHFVINNRTKNRFQFAPVVNCVSIQNIEIKYFKTFVYPEVIIDGKMMSYLALGDVAINDGFDSVDDFFAYFNKDFKGKIIHWTDLRY